MRPPTGVQRGWYWGLGGWALRWKVHVELGAGWEAHVTQIGPYRSIAYLCPVERPVKGYPSA